MKPVRGDVRVGLMLPFSILERIDVGETGARGAVAPADQSFSILERIDVGETLLARAVVERATDFQYPRTDRRG